MSYREQDVKRVYYLSMEFLMGRSLLNALYNLQISGPYSEVRRTLAPFPIRTTSHILYDLREGCQPHRAQAASRRAICIFPLYLLKPSCGALGPAYTVCPWH